MVNIFSAAYKALMLDDINDKLQAVNHMYTVRQFNYQAIEVVQLQQPGRPEKPELVAPRNLEQRKLTTLTGKASLLHSIAHIEFNAINLALDAIYRFQDLPLQYYQDWLQVAYEEAKHFTLLRDYLVELGYNYGDFPAHNGLWEMAVKTADDVLKRMALVPRLLEARGLDVTPGLIDKFKAISDKRAVEILSIIYQEEIGHVLIGNTWYNYLCEQRKLNKLNTFKQLLGEYANNAIKKPIGKKARLAAGFTSDEIEFLLQLN